MNVDEFKTTPAGAFLGMTFSEPGFVEGMIAFSEHSEPAVKHVGKRLADKNFPLTNSEKQVVGKWVREIMETRGWTISTRKGRVEPNKTFLTGEIYIPKSA